MAKKSSKEMIKVKKDKSVQVAETARRKKLEKKDVVETVKSWEEYQKEEEEYKHKAKTLTAQGRGASNPPVEGATEQDKRLPRDEQFSLEKVCAAEVWEEQATNIGEAGKSFLGVEAKTLDPKEYAHSLVKKDESKK